MGRASRSLILPLVIVGTAAVAAAVSVSAAEAPGARQALSVGDAIKELDLIRPARQKLAQDFTLKTPGGGSFRLSDHRGKIVLINFWATWCPPCREEMPSMDRLYRKHREQGFVMVAVSVDADPGVVPPFVREHKLGFAVALDPKMEAANVYGVRALPSSFIVDKKGMMAALALGPRTWDSLAAHSLIAGMVR